LKSILAESNSHPINGQFYQVHPVGSAGQCSALDPMAPAPLHAVAGQQAQPACQPACQPTFLPAGRSAGKPLGGIALISCRIQNFVKMEMIDRAKQ